MKYMLHSNILWHNLQNTEAPCNTNLENQNDSMKTTSEWTSSASSQTQKYFTELICHKAERQKIPVSIRSTHAQNV